MNVINSTLWVVYGYVRPPACQYHKPIAVKSKRRSL